MNSIFYDDGKRWKKIKLTLIIFAFFVSTLTWFCVYTLLQSPYSSPYSNESKSNLKQQIENINAQARVVEGQGTFLSISYLENEAKVQRFGNTPKRAILTFDDGPDPLYTPRILEVLDSLDVNATFFFIGSNLYNNPQIGHRVLESGSDIGLHTYSHLENTHDITLPTFTFTKEIDYSAKLFQHLYGYKNLLFRIPFVGTDDTLSYDALQYLRETVTRGMIISAPTVDSLDWDTKDPNVIVERSINKPEGVETTVILLHDGGGDREATIQAIPKIVSYYRSQGYTFTTMSSYAKELGLNYKQELTTYEKVVSAIAYELYHLYRKAPSLLDKGFILGFILVVIHSGIFVFAAFVQRFFRNNRRPILDIGPSNTFVSVIVPMYNEEKSILKTINSILNSSYKYFELIVVDDGSTDDSLKLLKQFKKNRRVKVFSKPNGGKYSALNHGLERAKGDIIVFVDADTALHTNSLSNIIEEFRDRKIGAVAGNIIVGNRVNTMTVLQSLEYTIGQNIDKRVADLFRRVIIAPGAFSAWRARAVKKAGGFSSETHAEDFDLTLSIMKQGYFTRFCDKAIAYTETPQSIPQLIKQRLRWNFGNLQVYFKHKDMLFNGKYDVFGLLLFPREILMNLPATLLTPLVDIFIILSIFVGNRTLTMTFLLFYLLNQLMISFAAYKLYGSPLRDILYTPLIRFTYTKIMYALLIATVLRALKGELVAWTKMTHLGNLPLAEKFLTTTPTVTEHDY